MDPNYLNILRHQLKGGSLPPVVLSGDGIFSFLSSIASKALPFIGKLFGHAKALAPRVAKVVNTASKAYDTGKKVYDFVAPQKVKTTLQKPVQTIDSMVNKVRHIATDTIVPTYKAITGNGMKPLLTLAQMRKILKKDAITGKGMKPLLTMAQMRKILKKKR